MSYVSRSLLALALVGCGGSKQNGDVDSSTPSDAADITACPAGAPVSDRVPAARSSVYPALRYSDVSTLGATAASACVDTSALPSHGALDALVPQILREAGLQVAPAGSCECDWWLVYAA